MLINAVWLNWLVLGAAGLLWLLLLARFVWVRVKGLSDRTWWSDFPKYSFFLLSLLGVLGLGLLGEAATPTWVVREQGVEARCVKHYLFGSYGYTFQDGQAARLDAFGETNDILTDPTQIVVNDTTRSLEIRRVRYGLNIGSGAVSEVIAPMTARPVLYLDYCGPENSPPATIQSQAPVGVLRWLTW